MDKTLPEARKGEGENPLLAEVAKFQAKRLERLENSSWKKRFKKALAIKIVQLAIPASQLLTDLIKVAGTEDRNDIDFFQTVPIPQQTITRQASDYQLPTINNKT